MPLSNLLLLGLATATISVTVGQSRIFQGFRSWVRGHWTWGGELISCPYCLGHWVAAVLLLSYWSHLTWWDTGFHRISTLITWLAVTAVAALISGTIGRLFTDAE